MIRPMLCAPARPQNRRYLTAEEQELIELEAEADMLRAQRRQARFKKMSQSRISVLNLSAQA